MINRRLREGIKSFHKPDKKIKFCLGALAILSVCLLLLVISTFTQIKINLNPLDKSAGSYLMFEYIPQVPVVLFIAGLLGETWGLACILIYIILGLTPWFSLFALGGGLGYVFQYNFGYIFAYIFSVILASKELNKGNSLLNIIFAVLYGVLSIHVVGIIYMIIAALIRHDGLDFIANWIYYQSISKILYDIVFSTIAVLIAKACRKIMWFFMS